MSKDSNLEIYTVPRYEGNAYIMELAGDYFDTLWSTPLKQDGTSDNSQWSIVEDETIINNVLDSNERIIIDEIKKSSFLKLLEVD